MSGNRPIPLPTPLTAPFWDGLKDGKIMLQRCQDCGQWTFYPRRHCRHCLSHALCWEQVSGHGQVYAFTVARIPTLPEFAGPTPQILAVVELEQGERINTTLVGLESAQIQIGMPVRPVFATVNPQGTVLLRYTGMDTDLTWCNEMPAAPTPIEAPAPKRRSIDVNDEAAMQALVSDEFSDWSNPVLVDQELIDAFAELSGDDYWIHTDPERARREGPFGGTIAHGALVQVLVSRMQIPQAFEIVGFTNMVNYGSDRLRFPSPVPAGAMVHARARIKAVERIARGTRLCMEINVHVLGQERPSVINDLVILYMS